MPGRTFARASHDLLCAMGFEDVYQSREWKDGGNNCTILQEYKTALRHRLEAQSRASWLDSLRLQQHVDNHIAAQHAPSNAGLLLLNHSRLDLPGFTDQFDKLRLNQQMLVQERNQTGAKHCILRGSADHGLPHILATYPAAAAACARFKNSDHDLRNQLQNALPGDWPIAILSPHWHR